MKKIDWSKIKSNIIKWFVFLAVEIWVVGVTLGTVTVLIKDMMPLVNGEESKLILALLSLGVVVSGFMVIPYVIVSGWVLKEKKKMGGWI